MNLHLQGTEKQIKYATDLLDRLEPRISLRKKEIQESIKDKRELGETEEAIAQSIAKRMWDNDLALRTAFKMGGNPLPETLSKPEVLVSILDLSLQQVKKETSAKKIIDLLTPESTTVFVSNYAKKFSFIK